MPVCARRVASGAGGAWIGLYRALTSAVSPLLMLHLQWRRCRGLEHAAQWHERLGHASLPRPVGALLWFHAVSVGEAMAAIPMIKHCISTRPSVHILITTSTVSSYFVVQKVLPQGVLCQFAPIDTPAAVERFLSHWHPDVGIFMESELWPNLLMFASAEGMFLVLLNARMSHRSFEFWSYAKPLVKQILSTFCLIVPLSTNEAVRYQLLGASPMIIQFAGNLKYAIGALINGVDTWDVELSYLNSLLNGRRVWIAASTHANEEDVIAQIHAELKKTFPLLLTIIVPRHPQRGSEITEKLRQHGLQVAQRSCQDALLSNTDVYVADTIGELRLFYEVSQIAFIGGSLLEGMAGHNFSEAAAMHCAVITGPHIGHFSQMVSDFQRISPLSVQQVSGKEELLDVLYVLLGDARSLEARKEAAQRASVACAEGVVSKVWNLLDVFVLNQAFGCNSPVTQS